MVFDAFWSFIDHSVALIVSCPMNATRDSLVKLDRRGRLRYEPE